MNLEEQINDRERRVQERHKKLLLEIEKLSTEMETAAYKEATLDVEKGRISQDAKNYTNAEIFMAKLRRTFSEVYKKIARLIILDSDEIIDDVEEFIGDSSQEARELIFLRLGYNVRTKEVTQSGYLFSIFQSEPTTARVAALMNSAIGQGMPIEEYRRQFGSIFGKAGVLRAHFETTSFDLYQMIDRAANKVYADRLNLKYAIYSGTIMKTTRDFCRQRVNKVFTRAEIEGWSEEEWSGKLKVGYDPYIHCGGHRCRHHISFVSDAIGEALKNGA